MKVAVVMGSDSDFPILKPAVDLLHQFNVETEVIASYTTLPVIGVPINATPLNGMDALLSTVQMPSGIPVATMAINGAKNAAIFAIEIFAVSDMNLRKQLKEYREKMVEEVEAKAAKVAQQLQA